MTIRITQLNDEEFDRTVLRLDGKLNLEDAEILEDFFENLRVPNGNSIEIDLAGITFINSESAAVLKRIEAAGANLKGQDFFIRTVIEAQENKEKIKTKKITENQYG